MTRTLWTRQEILLIVAILSLACAAAFLSVKLTRPKPFATSVVSQWQCTKSAGTVAVCTRKSARANASQQSRSLFTSA